MLRNKLLYVIMVMLTGFYAILYNVYDTMEIFVALLCVPIVLFVMLLISMPFVSMNISVSNTIVSKGEIIKAEVILKNNFIFPLSNVAVILEIYGEGTKKIHKKIITSLGCREVKKVYCDIKSKNCGYIVLKTKRLWIYDVLKIFSLPKRMKNEFSIAVIPKIYDVEVGEIYENHSEVMESDTYSKSKCGDDPSEIFDIREYRQGDKIHRIHWKLSSKKNNLMVKEFSLPVCNNILIMVELKLNANKKNIRDYMDAVLESVFSISFALLQNGNVHDIGFYNTDSQVYSKKKIASEEDFFGVLAELLRCKSYKTEALTLKYENALYNDRFYTHSFYVTSSVEGDEIAMFLSEHERTKNTVIYVMDSQNKKNIENELLELDHVNVHKVDIRCTNECIGGILVE